MTGHPVDGTITDPDAARLGLRMLAWEILDGGGRGHVAARLAELALWLDGLLSNGGPLPTAWAADGTARDDGRPVADVALPGDRPAAEAGSVTLLILRHPRVGNRCPTCKQAWPCDAAIMLHLWGGADYRRHKAERDRDWWEARAQVIMTALAFASVVLPGDDPRAAVLANTAQRITERHGDPGWLHDPRIPAQDRRGVPADEAAAAGDAARRGAWLAANRDLVLNALAIAWGASEPGPAETDACPGCGCPDPRCGDSTWDHECQAQRLCGRRARGRAHAAAFHAAETQLRGLP